MKSTLEPIFIVGLPRSGSTLLLNIFAEHPSIFRIGEIHFLTPFKKDYRFFFKKYIKKLPKEERARKLVDYIFSTDIKKGISSSFWRYDILYANTPEFKMKLLKRIEGSDYTIQKIFPIILEELATYFGYSRFCAKFPVYLNYIPFLLECYPDCKIIQIIRDSRAIALSKTNDPGGTKKKISIHPHFSFLIKKTMIAFVVLQYIWTAILHKKYMGRYQTNYKLVRYEELIENPVKIIQDLCRFANLDYCEKMANPKKGQASSITGQKKEGIDKLASERWRSEISVIDKKIITLLTKRSMKNFEYK